MENVAVFSSTCFESFAYYDRSTSLWRTYQASFLEPSGWALFSGKWPRAGTTQNGIVFRRRVLVPRTCAIGSSLWDTPSVADAHPRALNRSGPYRGKGQKHLQAQVYNKAEDEEHQKKIQELFPTPVKYDATPGGPNNHYKGLGHMGKHGKLEMFPTPRVSAYKDAKTNRGKSNLGEVVVDPRPDPMDSYPTPKARDWRQGDKPESRRARRKASGKGHLPDLNDVAAPGAVLNPGFVEWLQGFPQGWTEQSGPSLRQEGNAYPWGAEWEGVPRIAPKDKNTENRIKCLGNAIVPQVMHFIGSRIMEHHELTSHADPQE